MNNHHTVILVPGLGDGTWLMSLATRHWHRKGLNPVVHTIGWRTQDTRFQPKLQLLIQHIDELREKGELVSLVGTSAGGSAIVNAFIQRKNVIHRVVNICGRLRQGTQTGFRSFQSRTASSPAFAQSVTLCEEQEPTLSNTDRKKIMTIRSLIGDELVPAETATIKGSYNTTVPIPGHMLSISLSLTVLSNPLITFIRETS